MIGRLPLGYLITLCILSGVIVLELMPGTKADDPSMAIRFNHSIMPRRDPIHDKEKPPTVLVASVLARPLFSPTRRPAPPARQRDVHEAPPRLSGVIVYGTERLAIFSSPHDGKSIVAAEGARVGDWVIGSIRPSGVTVVGQQGARRIQPVFTSAPAMASSLPPAPKPDPVVIGMRASRQALIKLLDGNNAVTAGQ